MGVIKKNRFIKIIIKDISIVIDPGKMRLIQSCFTEDLVEKFLHKLKSYIIK